MIKQLLVAFLFLPPVLSFNALGHQLIASIAQTLLTDKTRDALAGIVNPNSLDLSAIAPWADRVKHTHAYFWSGSLHYINPIQDYPPETCTAAFSDVRTPNRTLLTAIANYTERLSDETLDRWPREEALRFLVHFMGDAEQPLHLTGRARGGNDIHLRFNGKNTSLHSVWDGLLISKLQRTLSPPRIRYDQFLTYLLEELRGRYLNSTARWLACSHPITEQEQIVLNVVPGGYNAHGECVENWMEETHQFNCRGVWSFDTGSVRRERFLVDRDLVAEYWAKQYGVDEVSGDMYGEYFDVDLAEGDYWEWIVYEEVVQQMLIRGGVRLASILNRVFDK